MSDEPTGHGRVVEGPQPAVEGKAQPLPVKKKRPLKKVLTPLVLGFVGLALLLGAFFLYPRTTQPPTPGYTEVDLTTTALVNVIGFEVKTTSFPAKMTVQVLLDPHMPAAPTTLKVWLPIGLRFADCHSPCGVLHTGKLFQSYWTKTMTFKPGADNALEATAKFTVLARPFGVVFNGVDASATIPEIVYGGAGQSRTAVDYCVQRPISVQL